MVATELSLQTVMAASDSEIDENAIHDVEADLLESVYVYLIYSAVK